MSNPDVDARRLVDRSMYDSDPMYHAQIAQLRQLLTLVDMALRDEGVADEIAARVLRRITYGTPSGADAYERVAFNAADIKRLSGQPHDPGGDTDR